MLVPVILCGGSGTRLWPLSRELYPKQLLPLIGDRTMLQETAARLHGPASVSWRTAWSCATRAHRFLVAGSCGSRAAAARRIILEPEGRNTAPAVAVAALSHSRSREAPGRRRRRRVAARAARRPRDPRRRGLGRAVAAGMRGSDAGKLVTFGVVPTAPRRATATSAATQAAGPAYAGRAVRREARLLRRPGATSQSGDYFWNSGMFLFRARTSSGTGAHAPAIASACERRRRRRPSAISTSASADDGASACRKESIDYAVMEKTSRAVVVPLVSRLERRRLLGRPAGCSCRDAQGNVADGRRRGRGLPGLLRARREPAGRGRRASRAASSSRPRMRCWWCRGTGPRTSRRSSRS